jgi:UDP-N-acetylglucosamine:LPS N-acetylglucosamine transferase
MKTKVLILTSKGGQGLISGSIAIQEALAKEARTRQIELETEIVDFFEQYSSSGEWLTKIYNGLLRKSLFLNAIYVRLLHALRPDRWTFLYSKPLLGLKTLLAQKRPDILIVTSQYMVSLIGTGLRMEKNPPLSFVGNIDPGTSCVPLWFDDRIDFHLIPTAEAMTAYRQYGHNPANAIQAKLTVRQTFLDAANTPREIIRKQLGWDTNHFVLLFAGSREGYAGLIPLIQNICSALQGLRIVVICGTNDKLKTEVDRWGRRQEHNIIEALGWRDDVHLLMRGADLIIAKPGKQTMKETVKIGTPWIPLIFPAVMQQELGNLEFMKNRGVFLEANNLSEMIDQVRRMQTNPKLLLDLRERLSQAALDIDPRVVAKAILEKYLARDMKNEPG